MVWALPVCLLQVNAVEQLDTFAKARDIKGIESLAAPELVKRDAFRFLQRGGAYGVGRYPWSVVRLKDAGSDKQYAVFTTRLTNEDIGEQVFELKGEKLEREVDEGDNMGFQVKRWDFDVSFRPETKQAFILAETTFHRLPGAGQSLQIRLSPHYHMGKVTDSSGAEVPFEQGGGVVSIKAASTDTFTYTLNYSGEVNQPGFAGNIQGDEAMLTEDYWYPMIAREPAPFSIVAHVPEEWAVVAQGRMESDQVASGVRTVKYVMDVPVSYLSLSAGKYKVAQVESGGKTYRVWSKVMADQAMQDQVNILPAIFDYYSETFGANPFRGWGALVTRLYSGGALEAYSFATYGPGWLPANEGHETAHTWFGGLLVNTYLKSFWNESFADWADGLYHRRGPIGNRAEKEVASMPAPFADPSYNRASCAEAGAEAGPVASSVGYGKGADVLLQMEQEFPQMLSWVKEWVQERPAQRSSNWEDFEKVCGSQTKWFFDQWIRGKGYPKFQCTNVKWAKGEVTGNVSFTGSPYRLTTDVLLTVNGKNQFKKVVLNPDRVQTSSFRIPCAKKPSMVALDPWDRLLTDRTGADPDRIAEFFGHAKCYVAAGSESWLTPWRSLLGRANPVNTMPSKLDGWLLITDPSRDAQAAKLLKSVGFIVKGNKLTYDGTTIDLNAGCAIAMVALPDGGKCAFALGKSRITPEVGKCKLGLFDVYGRMLRAVSDPRTKGNLAFKL
ncbi:MAG: hypothetical protein JSS66_13310 [Armatimonadetes bacterium]|nr:hypothetical protein [Armatimonadota bacterium]